MKKMFLMFGILTLVSCAPKSEVNRDVSSIEQLNAEIKNPFQQAAFNILEQNNYSYGFFQLALKVESSLQLSAFESLANNKYSYGFFDLAMKIENSFQLEAFETLANSKLTYGFFELALLYVNNTKDVEIVQSLVKANSTYEEFVKALE